jgi:SAM-dependent methyltransferase
MNYKLAYAVGFHPWEDAEDQPEFVEKITELFAREENGRPPRGRVLDIGTGSGIWGIQLAKRGWHVAGVDTVPQALRRAHDRAKEAGVDIRLVHGDVTDLRATGIGSGFQLLLDTGTFHGLTPDQRVAMGREIDAVASDDATVLLLAWKPKRRGPLPRGASRSEIEDAFPGWKVTDVEASGFAAPKPVEVFLKPDEHWYRLRREFAVTGSIHGAGL